MSNPFNFNPFSQDGDKSNTEDSDHDDHNDHDGHDGHDGVSSTSVNPRNPISSSSAFVRDRPFVNPFSSPSASFTAPFTSSSAFRGKRKQKNGRHTYFASSTTSSAEALPLNPSYSTSGSDEDEQFNSGKYPSDEEYYEDEHERKWGSFTPTLPGGSRWNETSSISYSSIPKVESKVPSASPLARFRGRFSSAKKKVGPKLPLMKVFEVDLGILLIRVVSAKDLPREAGAEAVSLKVDANGGRSVLTVEAGAEIEVGRDAPQPPDSNVMFVTTAALVAAGVLWNGALGVRKNRTEAAFRLRSAFIGNSRLYDVHRRVAGILASVDPCTKLSRRFLIHTLLRGDSSSTRNQKEVDGQPSIYLSFFRNPLLEPHLIPLIVDYIFPRGSCETLKRSTTSYFAEGNRYDHMRIDSVGTAAESMFSNQGAAGSLTLCFEEDTFAHRRVFKTQRQFFMATLFVALSDTSKIEHLRLHTEVASSCLKMLTMMNLDSLISYSSTIVSLKELPLKSLKNLKSISFEKRGCLIQGSWRLESLPEGAFSSLESFSLGQAHNIEHKDFLMFSESPLKVIKISGCRTTNSDLSFLSSLRNASLEILTLEGEFTDLTFLCNAKCVETLKVLDISNRYVRSLEPLTKIASLSLRSLILHGCPLESLEALAHINTSSLAVLDVSGIQFTREMVSVFRKMDTSSIILLSFSRANYHGDNNVPHWLRSKISGSIIGQIGGLVWN